MLSATAEAKVREYISRGESAKFTWAHIRQWFPELKASRRDVYRLAHQMRQERQEALPLGDTPSEPETPAADDPRPVAGGVLSSPDEARPRLAGRRFVFTAAQNNTYVHEKFWDALQVFIAERGAELYVSRFSYNKSGWAKATVDDNDADQWYDPKIVPYILDHQVKVADDLVFCGELDILPTAVNPLQGLQSYTGPNSGIVPHVKVHMQSLATMKNEPAKFMYTTGAVTLRNYIARRAGQVATFHHTFGALYVEVNDAGEWYARQLIADDNGVFYDIDRAYGPNWVSAASDLGDSVITLGDIHVEKIDYKAWNGACDLIREVRPKHIFLHDLVDFAPRNHHNIDSPYFMAKQYWKDKEDVREAYAVAATLLKTLSLGYPSSTIYVVQSNHDDALKKWLGNKAGAYDPANAWYWHKLNAIWHEHIKNDTPCNIFKTAINLEHVRMYSKALPENVRFVDTDESVVINSIEYGMHGHLGPNGARGTPQAFRQLGRKANTGHTHSAGIIDGVWTAGVLGKLEMDYNVGPSSWSHSNIITYPSGKRAMITQRGSEWRA